MYKRQYLQRKDLIYTGRTLFGAMPPKGQELDDHYFGNIRQRIAAFMKEVNEEPVSYTHLDVYKRQTRSCEMVFGNIYLWSRFYNTGFAIVEDNLIFGEVDGVYSYTFPVGPGDKKKTINALMEHCKENGENFQLHSITKEDFAKLEELYPGRFEIKYDRNYADYVYETEKLARCV